jgi:fumarate reductase flavoprotein subunit
MRMMKKAWRPVSKTLILRAGLMASLLTLWGCETPRYQAGTYTAAGQGYGGEVKVEVDFDAQSILAVRVVEETETREFAAVAISALPGNIVAAQTYQVDSVSSATLTGNAIKDAVRACMEQAAAKGANQAGQ